MGTHEIIEMAMQLKASERLEVAEILFRSLDKPDPEIERTWGEEALRRLRAYDEGRLETVSLEDALRDGVRTANMRAALTQGYATATDLADYLVKKGVTRWATCHVLPTHHFP